MQKERAKCAPNVVYLIRHEHQGMNWLHGALENAVRCSSVSVFGRMQEKDELRSGWGLFGLLSAGFWCSLGLWFARLLFFWCLSASSRSSRFSLTTI